MALSHNSQKNPDVNNSTKISAKSKENIDFRDLLEFAPHIFALADFDANIIYMNKRGLETFGISEEEIEKKVPIKKFIIPNDFERSKDLFMKLKSGVLDEYSVELTAVKKDGKYLPVLIYANRIENKGQSPGVRLSVINLTRLKRTENALSETEKKLSKLMQNFSGMAYLCRVEKDFPAEYISDGFYELTGYSHSDIIKDRPVALKSIIHPDDYSAFEKKIYQSIQSRGIFEARFRIITAKGEVRWVWNQGRLIKDDKGKISAVEGFVSNITELVRTEQTLYEIEKQRQQCTIDSLHEKEILLKEIHHRVKNNLQIIASILKLKDMQSESSEIHELLLDCRSRVFSMAMIHEKLYKSENLARINLKDYLSTLLSHLADEYGAYEKNIRFTLDCDEDIALDIDTAIPCGLIINEIFTNSLKYAFDESGGEIALGFKNAGPDTYRLFAKDSGRGFAQSYDFLNSESLGMQLIYNLTAQLEGKIEVSGKDGVAYIITIPKSVEKSVKL